MSQAIRESFMKISSLFEEQDAATTDIPFVKYPDYENLTEENIRMVIGFKSAKLLQRKDDITLRGIPARKVVSCLPLPEQPQSYFRNLLFRFFA